MAEIDICYGSKAPGLWLPGDSPAGYDFSTSRPGNTQEKTSWMIDGR